MISVGLAGIAAQYIRRLHLYSGHAPLNSPLPVPPMTGPVLALDTGSPQVSVAVAEGGLLRSARSAHLERSSTQLLGLIDEALHEAGARPAGLAGVLALRGPGSFTGLRIGLATALGLHQALALPATALSTFQALAAAAGRPGAPLVAVSDALRGEWSVQLFPTGDPAAPAGEPRLLAASAIAAWAAELAAERGALCTVTGFGLDALDRGPGGAVDWREAEALAGPAAAWFTGEPREWHAPLLSEPLYSRPPAVSRPKARQAPAPAPA